MSNMVGPTNSPEVLEMEIFGNEGPTATADILVSDLEAEMSTFLINLERATLNAIDKWEAAQEYVDERQEILDAAESRVNYLQSRRGRSRDLNTARS